MVDSREDEPGYQRRQWLIVIGFAVVFAIILIAAAKFDDSRNEKDAQIWPKYRCHETILQEQPGRDLNWKTIEPLEHC